MKVGDLVQVLVRKPFSYSETIHLVWWISDGGTYAKLFGFEENQLFSVRNLKVIS